MQRLAGACAHLILHTQSTNKRATVASVLGYFVSTQSRASTSHLLLSGQRRQ